jgi:hypothetical protein
MPDRAENNFGIMRCRARVVPLRIVNKKLLRKCERKARLLVLTPIAKPMNRFAACGDPRAERGPRIDRRTQSARRRSYIRLRARVDHLEDAISHFYNVINELRTRVSTLEKKLKPLAKND